MLILDQHDQQKILGTIEMTNDCLEVRLKKPLTRAEFFEAFGNVGVIFNQNTIEKNDSALIHEARILEFSVSPLEKD